MLNIKINKVWPAIIFSMLPLAILFNFFQFQAVALIIFIIFLASYCILMMNGLIEIKFGRDVRLVLYYLVIGFSVACATAYNDSLNGKITEGVNYLANHLSDLLDGFYAALLSFFFLPATQVISYILSGIFGCADKISTALSELKKLFKKQSTIVIRLATSIGGTLLEIALFGFSHNLNGMTPIRSMQILSTGLFIFFATLFGILAYRSISLEMAQKQKRKEYIHRVKIFIYRVNAWFSRHEDNSDDQQPHQDGDHDGIQLSDCSDLIHPEFTPFEIQLAESRDDPVGDACVVPAL